MNDITWTELASETFAELRGVSGTKLKNPWKSKGRQIVASAFASASQSEPSVQQLGAVQPWLDCTLQLHLSPNLYRLRSLKLELLRVPRDDLVLLRVSRHAA